jgi:hypothetical protein
MAMSMFHIHCKNAFITPIPTFLALANTLITLIITPITGKIISK